MKDRDIVTGTPPEWITATAMPRTRCGQAPSLDLLEVTGLPTFLCLDEDSDDPASWRPISTIKR